MLDVTHLIGFGAGGGVAAATVSYRTNANTGNSYGASTKTFSALDIGTASADRIVIVALIGIPNAGTVTISSVTIGGVSAASCCTGIGDTQAFVEFWAATVPSGTTGDVAVTASGNMFNCFVGVWATTGLGSGTATASGTSTADPGSASLNISAGGIALGAGFNSNNAPNVTWSNLTEDFDSTQGGSRTYTGASQAFAAAQTGLSLSADYASSANPRTVLAAFR